MLVYPRVSNVENQVLPKSHKLQEQPSNPQVRTCSTDIIPTGAQNISGCPWTSPIVFFKYPLGIPNAIHRRYLLRTLFHANPQLKFSSQSAEVCWSVHHRGTILSATDAEIHAAARHPQLRWSKSSHTMAETHGCLAVNYTFNGRCKNQRWEHVLSLTWIHANQKHLVTNW